MPTHALGCSCCKLAQVGNPCCTAEILLKPGALQNWGLNQERNAVVVNQVKRAELR